VPVFVRDGFVEDGTHVGFFNKLNDTKLGNSSNDMVKWGLTIKLFEVPTFE